MGPQRNNYGNWTVQELRRAESVAQKFLLDNGDQIWENFRAKANALDELVTALHRGGLTFDERLNCFARIAEIGRVLQDDAEGFFALAAEPVIARLLAHVAGRPRP